MEIERNYARSGFGTWKMSRAALCGRPGMRAAISAMRVSSGLATRTIAGSAACAQHPQMAHVGGQALSSRPGCWYPVQGSASTNARTPEALNDSEATMAARANRRTD